jgi:type I restriction enzyme R subunit
VGYEPPYLIKTQLSEYGITWKPGETVKVYNRLTREIEHLDMFDDEIKMEVESFNKKVLTESFNRTVLKELINHISPDGPEKTLIFAASDDHATDVVRWLKEEFEKGGVSVDDDAIQKITGTVDKPHEAVKHFKNERMPTIVVTVDLLTTGVDVPAICNLVFLRRVNSRILYEQMLGRATRLCDEIGKESFRIFDAVGVYKNLEDFTNMKPVVTAPKSTLQKLVDEMDDIEKLDPDTKALAQQKQFEQIIAKLHRKKKRMTSEQQEQFESLSGGISPDDFIREIRERAEGKEAVDYLHEKKILFKFLDEMRGIPQYQIISEHDDRHVGTFRDYAFTDDAKDYIESFRKYILENRNKMAALDVICTRPTALTRDSLRELATQLSLAGYDAVKLNTAWKNATNERIAADIIAFIRSLALGNPLISHEDRIKNAMKKVRAMRDWTRIQQQWLDRFESQLISESILHKEDLDRGIFKLEGGGFARLDKIFGNELEAVLDTINENLYRESA